MIMQGILLVHDMTTQSAEVKLITITINNDKNKHLLDSIVYSSHVSFYLIPTKSQKAVLFLHFNSIACKYQVYNSRTHIYFVNS